MLYIIQIINIIDVINIINVINIFYVIYLILFYYIINIIVVTFYPASIPTLNLKYDSSQNIYYTRQPSRSSSISFLYFSNISRPFLIPSFCPCFLRNLPLATSKYKSDKPNVYDR